MEEAAFKGLVIVPCYNQIILFQCSGCLLGPAVCLLFHVINTVSILLHLSIVPGCIQRLPLGNCASLFWIALSGNVRWLPCKVCIYIFFVCVIFVSYSITCKFLFLLGLLGLTEPR